MSIIGWLVPGLIAGVVAGKLVNNTGGGLVLDIVPGIVGAVAGGSLFPRFGAAGVAGFDLRSMFVSLVGAVVVVLLPCHAPVGHRTL
jgi:uncharacterized membrane protein YeaQ/YmgE (transglycosylase-associated protein family)